MQIDHSTFTRTDDASDGEGPFIITCFSLSLAMFLWILELNSTAVSLGTFHSCSPSHMCTVMSGIDDLIMQCAWKLTTGEAESSAVQINSSRTCSTQLLGITLSASRRNRHIFPSFQAISMMNTTLLFMRKFVYLCDPNMLQSGLITSRVPRQAVVNMACTQLPYQWGKSAMHFRVLQYSIRWQSPSLKQLGIFHSVTLISL